MSFVMQAIASPKIVLKVPAGGKQSAPLAAARLSLQKGALSGRSLTLLKQKVARSQTSSSSSSSSSSSVCITAHHALLPPRVVAPSLPRILVYDHCPFCVRVRLALGLKNIKHEVVFLANDDIDTPVTLVGKKVAPILERRDIGLVMKESLDIIAYFDENPEWGPTGAFAPSSGRSDIKAWQKEVKDTLRLLHRPRYMKASLPEFQQQDSRDYFVSGHPVPPFEKPEWKALPLERQWALYDEAMAQSDKLIPEINSKLKKLDSMIACEHYATVGGLSYDDIDLWARLRSLTIVNGLVMPPKLATYMKNLSEAGDIPLYHNMAC